MCFSFMCLTFNNLRECVPNLGQMSIGVSDGGHQVRLVRDRLRTQTIDLTSLDLRTRKIDLTYSLCYSAANYFCLCGKKPNRSHLT